jgi:hypothetical protein
MTREIAEGSVTLHTRRHLPQLRNFAWRCLKVRFLRRTSLADDPPLITRWTLHMVQLRLIVQLPVDLQQQQSVLSEV